MKKILFYVALNLFSINAFAELKTSDVSAMIDSMVAKGVLSATDAKAAKAKLSNISQDKWNQINSMAAREIASTGKNPNVNNNVDSAADNIDLNSNEFKNIESKLKNIIE